MSLGDAISRNRRALLVVCLLVASGVGAAPGASSPRARPQDSIALQWNTALLKAVRSGVLGPPMVSRALAIAHTCMYDAWAAYDGVAVGTELGATLRRPVRERTLRNIRQAVSFAAYRAAVDLYPGSKASVFDPLMAELGYDGSDTTEDTSTGAGVGNVACAAVLEMRHHDGSNQLGDEPGSSGAPYSDYTGYQPVNEPMDLTPGGSFDPDTVHDPSRWQPLRYVNKAGAVVTPTFLTPHWYHVAPFALDPASLLRSPTAPAQDEDPAYVDQALAVLNLSANLTDEHKAISEYWSDGPASETPPGHWNLFAQYISRRDHHGPGLPGIERDIKMFFALTNAVLDAGIVAWDNKIAFDSVRPITAIRYLFNGLPVMAWGGPGQGTTMIDGGDWFPYQPTFFPTPPFAEYSSGHSTFSGAAAAALRLFTGNDEFGASATIAAGSSVIEPGITPMLDVTLSWATFTEAADEAGISRRYGGIHFEQGDVDAREDGVACGELAWQKALSYFNGTAG